MIREIKELLKIVFYKEVEDEVVIEETYETSAFEQHADEWPLLFKLKKAVNKVADAILDRCLLPTTGGEEE